VRICRACTDDPSHPRYPRFQMRRYAFKLDSSLLIFAVTASLKSFHQQMEDCNIWICWSGNDTLEKSRPF